MNIFTRDMNFVNFNTVEMEWVKFNGNLVYEAWKTLTAQGVPPLTISGSGKNVLDYKIYGNTIQGVPSEYQIVEYIQSNGNQYIDTEVYGNQNISVEVDFASVSSVSASSNVAIVGSWFNTPWSLRYSTNALYFYYGSDQTDGGTGQSATIGTTRHTVKVEKNIVYLDGSLLHTYTANDFTTERTMSIFGQNGGASVARKSSIKLYRLKIFNGDMLIRDYIPCYRKSNNVIGVYDVVNQEFKINEGTGAFTKGSDTTLTISFANPVAYLSVGDLVTDAQDVNYGKYRIPVLVNNTPTNIYLNEPLRKLVRDSSNIFIDYIDFANQKVVRNTREVVVTGNEAWETISSGTPRMFRYKLSSQKIGPETQSSFPDQFCNYANCRVVTVGGGEIGASAYYSSSVSGGGTIFRIRPTVNYTSVTIFTNMLKSLYNSGKPLKYVFPIYNRTEESVTLPDIALTRGQNIIDVDTLIKASNMYVEYKGK